MSLLNQVKTLIGIGPRRSFGSADHVFTGYVTITEQTIDEIEITQQPVQQGANVADHAFKKPVTFACQILFGANLFGKSLDTVYDDLVKLQSTFQPFTVTTPKRVYPNMLFKTLSNTTDRKTENVLSITASFEEVIIVPVTTALVPRAQLKNSGSNGGTQNVGKKSALLSIAQGIGLKP